MMINDIRKLVRWEIVNILEETTGLKRDVIAQITQSEIENFINSAEIAQNSIISIIKDDPHLFMIDAINFEKIDLSRIFYNKFQKNIKRLCIIPCSFYISKMLPYFKKYFKEIVLVDNFKRGELEGIPIITENELDPNKVDAFYISALTNEIRSYFQEKFKKYPQMDVLEFFSLVEKEELIITSHDDVIQEIINRNKSHKDIFFIGGFFLEMLVPTIYQLKSRGYNIFIIVEEKFSPRHGIKTDQLFEGLNVPVYQLPAYEAIHLVNKLSKGQIIFIANGSYLGSNIESNILLKILADVSSVPCGWLLLDVIRPPYPKKKPKIKVELYNKVVLDLNWDILFEISYKHAINSMDFIILNANTRDATKFLLNTTTQRNIINFYRYSVYHDSLRFQDTKAASKEFHIAVINSLFSTHNNDFIRSALDINILKSILRQGIHVHKFSAESDINYIKTQLNEYEKKYFHGEKVIFDQKELIEKLSLFDAGWMVHDSVALSNPIAECTSRFLKELYYLLGLTTVPTTFLIFIAAGIPVLVNRSMKGLLEEFPEEFLIPLEISEIPSLKNILSEANLPQRKKQCFNKRKGLTINKKIEELLIFIDNLTNN